MFCTRKLRSVLLQIRYPWSFLGPFSILTFLMTMFEADEFGQNACYTGFPLLGITRASKSCSVWIENWCQSCEGRFATVLAFWTDPWRKTNNLKQWSRPFPMATDIKSKACRYVVERQVSEWWFWVVPELIASAVMQSAQWTGFWNVRGSKLLRLWDNENPHWKKLVLLII